MWTGQKEPTNEWTSCLKLIFVRHSPQHSRMMRQKKERIKSHWKSFNLQMFSVWVTSKFNSQRQQLCENWQEHPSCWLTLNSSWVKSNRIWNERKRTHKHKLFSNYNNNYTHICLWFVQFFLRLWDHVPDAVNTAEYHVLGHSLSNSQSNRTIVERSANCGEQNTSAASAPFPVRIHERWTHYVRRINYYGAKRMRINMSKEYVSD